MDESYAVGAPPAALPPALPSEQAQAALQPISRPASSKKRRAGGAGSSAQASPQAALQPSSRPASSKKRRMDVGNSAEASPQAPPLENASALAAEDALAERRHEALHLLVQQDIDEGRAAKALEACGAHSSIAVDWAEEALTWLAVDNETAQEVDAMGHAMAASLKEAEERKASKPPVIEMNAEQLDEEFGDSQLLAVIRAHLPSLLCVQTARQSLAEYLMLEKRCKRWWLASAHYFAAVADKLAHRLAACLGQPAETSYAGAQPEAEVHAKQRRRRAGPKTQHKLAASKDASGDACTAVIQTFLHEQVQTVQQRVYAQPDVEGAMPAMFAACVPAQGDVIELLDDA